MKKVLLYFSVFMLFISCSKDLKKQAILAETIDYKKELQTFFRDNFNYLDSTKIIQQVSLKNVDKINALYKNSNHNLIWINDSISLSNSASKLIEELSKSSEYGLKPSFYNTVLLLKIKKELYKIKNKTNRYKLAADLELLLTNSYMLYGKHLNYGILDSIDSITILPRKKFKIDLTKYLFKAHKSDSLIERLFELQPKHLAYHKLQKNLVNYIKTSSLSTDNVEVKNFRIDSLKAIFQSKKALVLHKYLDSVTNGSIYFDALRKFQYQHGLKPDGLIGKNTAKALSKSPYEYYQSIVVNLERWRWKEEFPSDYLFVNMPAYELEFYRQDKIKLKQNVVIGKYKSQTPEIRDSLQYIVAYPYWYVPKKISLEEILVKTQKDSTYFKRNNFEVITYGKKPIDFETLDFQEINKGNFKYLIRQSGGGSNSLGLVKFIFPNKYAIYLHDTPSKSLFYKEKRAYSHGCVRVEKAFKLAEHILEYDKNERTIDSIKKYIKNQKEKSIKLNNSLPIFLYYFTTKVDDNNNLIFYNDVYDKDKLIVEQMRLKN